MLCFPLQSSAFHLIPEKIGENVTLSEVSIKYISLTESVPFLLQCKQTAHSGNHYLIILLT